MPKTGPQTQRVFFALWPAEGTREEVARWSDAFHALCGGRRMRTENLHLTLAFIGAIEAGRLDAISSAARGVSLRPCDFVLNQPGYWRHNRIAWLGATQIPPALAAMVEDLRAALTAAAVHFDPKPFVPHITLVRNARPPRELPQFDPVRWKVERFVLLASERDDKGPIYRVVAGF